MERITLYRDSKASDDESLDLDDDFHGYELLLLKKLQSDPVTCVEWREKLLKKITDDDFDLGEIPPTMWYMVITLDKKKNRFLKFVQSQVKKSRQEKQYLRDSLLTKYLNSHMFTELHLDAIFKYGDDTTLPKEIFSCPSVRSLSLKYNYLDKIPPDIGRMTNLEKLALTNNKLQNKSIPFTLSFCSKLETLMLDNNNLDALPGFLLGMKALKTVYRHGNHNYFKSTFMWYHTDVNDRILPILGVYDMYDRSHCPESLQFWAAKSLIGSKHNFYADPNVAPVLKDYISENYQMFNICGNCNITKLSSQSGYKVITFKNPYLGNTCVPFQHWACCIPCATCIEVPARQEQISAATDLDREYDDYIRQCQSQYNETTSGAKSKSLLLRRSGRKSHMSPRSRSEGMHLVRHRTGGVSDVSDIEDSCEDEGIEDEFHQQVTPQSYRHHMSPNFSRRRHHQNQTRSKIMAKSLDKCVIS